MPKHLRLIEVSHFPILPATQQQQLRCDDLLLRHLSHNITCFSQLHATVLALSSLRGTNTVAVEPAGWLAGWCGGERAADKQSVTAPLSQVGTEGHTSSRQGRPRWDWQTALLEIPRDKSWASTTRALYLTWLFLHRMPSYLHQCLVAPKALRFVWMFLPRCSSTSVGSIYLHTKLTQEADSTTWFFFIHAHLQTQRKSSVLM